MGVVETPQATPPAQGSNPPVDDEVIETSEVESEEQPAQTSENQDGNPEDQAEKQEVKPTRSERRIGQLLNKLKESGKTEVQPSNQRPGEDPGSLFTPEELEEGVVDPESLDKRISDRINSGIQQALQKEKENQEMAKVRQEFNNAAKEHESDLEGVKDLDPSIEKLAVQQYNALNFQYNPITGKQMFVPAVKFSEIVNKINETVQKVAGGNQPGEVDSSEDNKQYSQSVSQTQAIPTNGSISSPKKVREDTTDFSEFEKTFGSK